MLGLGCLFVGLFGFKVLDLKDKMDPVWFVNNYGPRTKHAISEFLGV